MSNDLYIFDMDETLVDGDCSMLWNQYLVDNGYVDIPNFIEVDKVLMARYAKGELDMEEYLDYVMQPLLTIPTTLVEDMVTDFVEKYVSPKVFQEARNLINSLLKAGIDMLVISATASFIVEKVAKSLGITESLGIDMVVKDSCFTSKVAGVPSYREGKIVRLDSWLSEQTKQYSRMHFYTDSINDLPLCMHADAVYLINPCDKLRAVAKEEWQIYTWYKTANFQ